MPEVKRLVGFGVLSWLIPFLASILFYGPGGVLLVGIDLFKSLMIVIGSATGAVLLVVYFSNIQASYIREGWITGIFWLLLNWVLDLVFLLPLSGQTVGPYFAEIGLRYLAILFMSLAVGYGIGIAESRS
ncbi:MAG: hypothetical protein LUQ17_03835 [Methanomicrobiales archaeon]|nr:hypothetical protein [Methanomicrobiales archaeon]